MSFLKRAFGLMTGEDDPFMFNDGGLASMMPLSELLEKQAISKDLYPVVFNNGGLASLTTGLGGTLGGSVMSSSRPSTILGLAGGAPAFDPSAFTVTDLYGSFQPGNRAEATQFRRDFLRETGTPALNEMGQPFITEDQIQQRIDDAVSSVRKDITSLGGQDLSWRSLGRGSRNFQDGGLVDSDLNMDEIELSQEEQDLLRMVVVALSEDSDLSNEERNLILAEAISAFGEEFIMSVMQMMAQSGDAGDGMSDDINARLSHGEYVIPADAVSYAGDGSTEVGARRLRDMVEELRIAKTGTPNQAPPVQMRGGGLAQYMYNDGGLAEMVEEEKFVIPPIPESLRRRPGTLRDIVEVSNEPIPLPGGGFISVEDLDFSGLPGALPESMIKKKKRRTYEF